MELLLIRHALPLRVSGPAGPADPELSEDGHEQARRLAGYLASERIHAVYSSPLRRAQQTAAAVGESQGVEVHLVDGIAEYDRESSEYIPVEQLKAEGHPMWKEILAGEVQAGHGVDAHQFRIGVVAALEEVISRHGGEKVVAVCHGGVINAYLSHILDIEDPTGFFYPDYTSIHRLMAAQSGERSLLTINERCHLRGTRLSSGFFASP